jgi:Fe-S cluster assembly protein SufD
MTHSLLLNPAEQAQQRLQTLLSDWQATRSVGVAQQEALRGFAQAALPTARDEDWKYTRLTGFWKLPLRWASEQVASSVTLPQLSLPDNAIQLVWVNGQFSERLSSSLNDLPSGLTVQIDSAATQLPQPFAGDAFAAMAIAGLSSQLVIEVAKNQRIERPIVVRCFGEAGVGQSLALSVTLGQSAELTLIEVMGGASDGAIFMHSRLDVSDNAQLTHLLWHDLADSAYSFGWRTANLQRDARLIQRSLMTSGLLSRQHFTVNVLGENAESNMATGVVALAKQTQDVRTHTRHACLNARSEQLHRFAIGGQANGVFHGDILVEKGADKTDANMATNNLLLSPTAQANSKPQLEIYADDVRCTHGVTSGTLDETQIFYLRARGIPEATARLMVSAAFAQAAVSDVSVPEVAETWQSLIQQKLTEAMS